ncbi:MAG: DegT/DnrJ/EryC1/StrS family aminotransferase, partial [Anaerolineaceae bacterium]|nr:DegT/DnrJ/EryC1/StrS family aminotransferase [Anaerolineaceae bacterium]
AIQDVLNSGKFILGPQEKDFEQEIAAYLGVKHAIGLASGTDALIIALRGAGIGPGDEVIVPAYTFFATAGAVLSVGATPVFVDITPDTYLMDTSLLSGALTEHTRAIIPVHLYGQAADMDAIMEFARSHNLIVIEDNAQAFGAEYKGRRTGSIGDIGCLSFFPSKNLGGYGDGGMLVTHSDELARMARMLRTHGWQKKYFPEVLGYNSRLDELQAAILRVKLKYVDGWNQLRREIARLYDQELINIGVQPPVVAPDQTPVYHLYMIRLKKRTQVQQALKAAGVASDIYYPQPLHHCQPCKGLPIPSAGLPVSEKASEELLAIPLYSEMITDQVELVVKTIQKAMDKE